MKKQGVFKMTTAIMLALILAFISNGCGGQAESDTGTGAPSIPPLTNTGTTSGTATSTGTGSGLRFDPPTLNASVGEVVYFSLNGGVPPYQFGFRQIDDCQSYDNYADADESIDQYTGQGWYRVGSIAPCVDRLCGLDSSGGEVYLEINISTGTSTGTSTSTGTATSTGTTTGTTTGTGEIQTVNCCPVNQAFWTGYYIKDKTTKYDDNMKLYVEDCGVNSHTSWIKIDLSSIPAGSVVTGAVLRFYVSDVRKRLVSNLGLWIRETSADPVSATASEITASTVGDMILTTTFKIPISSPGWISAEFKTGADGTDRLTQATSKGWFALKMNTGSG